MTRPRKKSRHKRDSNPGSSALEAYALPLGQRGGQSTVKHVGMHGAAMVTRTLRNRKAAGRSKFTVEGAGKRGWVGEGDGEDRCTHRQTHLNPPLACSLLKTECLLVGCLTSQQHASVSQGRICADNFTCCHTEIEAADQTFRLTQSQYTDTGPTSPSADPITPGAWQSSHWSVNV